MILDELKSIKSGRRERHQFAMVVAVASFLIGGVLLWRSGLHPAFFIAGVLLLIPVLIDTLFKTDTAIVLLPLQKVWMGIAVVMGTIMSTLILSLFFYGVFTAVRAVNSLLGKPLLDTTWAPEENDSYWIRRDSERYDAAQSEKQY